MNLIFKKISKKLFFDKYEDWVIWLINGSFRYKLLSLHNGILLNKKDSNNIGNFRRCIHRIEKGLIYKNKKYVFAEEYIYETVNFLYDNKNTNNIDNETLIWAESVLDLYFKVCHHTEKVKKSLSLYLVARSDKYCFPEWVPYEEKKRPVLSVNYNDLLNLALRRRSIRFFLNRNVEKVHIIKAMEISRYSPSACNRQSFKFLFYNDKKIVNEISKVPGGVEGYDLPSIIVVIGCYRGYFDERDINAPIIDSSLATMSFLLALETLGLSSVCINWPCNLNNEEMIRDLIKLETDEFVVMLIGVGWPDPEGKIPFSAKKTSENLLEFNARIK